MQNSQTDAADHDPLANIANEIERELERDAAAGQSPALAPRPAPLAPRPAPVAAAAPRPSFAHATTPVRPLARTADDEVTRFLGTAERMFITVRDGIDEAESRYNLARAAMADEFQRRMTALENEARESLRKLEADHKADVAKRRRMLDALTAMREA